VTPNERAAPGQERDPRLDERLDQRLSQQNTQPPFATQDVGRSAWAGRIATAWRGAVVGVLETGKLLAEAKAAMPRGAFTAMIENDLPFKPSTAQRLMKIAADERLANPAHVQHLPPHWGTLYELTKLSDQVFDAKLKSGEIHPEMERRDVVVAAKRDETLRRIQAQAGATPEWPSRRYPVIYADPPWRDDFGRSGRDTENHYPTMELDEIKALPVHEIATPDAVLFLWATPHMFLKAAEVLAAWGFSFRTNFVWGKDRAGLGQWGATSTSI
jgi:hypothetical protein